MGTIGYDPFARGRLPVGVRTIEAPDQVRGRLFPRIGLVGHSFGGWTVLATPEVEPRVRAVSRLGRPKRMFILRRPDHQHFLDDVEREHEVLRAMSFPGEAAWIPGAMRPMTELCSVERPLRSAGRATPGSPVGPGHFVHDVVLPGILSSIRLGACVCVCLDQAGLLQHASVIGAIMGLRR